VNKTNQFNLTTRRYGEAELVAMMDDPRILTLQCRLADKFGDNGMISVIVAKPEDGGDGKALVIDTWLMSCRVLGRQVECAALDVMVEEARRLGAERLIGEFLPTARNGLVKDHYRNLGFAAGSGDAEASRWTFALRDHKPHETHISIKVGQ
jgi:FkbH-like protein